MKDYPTEAELDLIRLWPTDKGFAELMEIVKDLWKWPDRIQQDGSIFYLSTGGWSGNEDIIGALRENVLFWAMCWVASKQGGHHWFEIEQNPIDVGLWVAHRDEPNPHDVMRHLYSFATYGEGELLDPDCKECQVAKRLMESL